MDEVKVEFIDSYNLPKKLGMEYNDNQVFHVLLEKYLNLLVQKGCKIVSYSQVVASYYQAGYLVYIKQ